MVVNFWECTKYLLTQPVSFSDILRLVFHFHKKFVVVFLHERKDFHLFMVVNILISIQWVSDYHVPQFRCLNRTKKLPSIIVNVKFSNTWVSHNMAHHHLTLGRCMTVTETEHCATKATVSSVVFVYFSWDEWRG